MPIAESDDVATLLEKTHSVQLEVFCDLIDDLAAARSPIEILSLEHEYSGPEWSERTYRIEEIDQLQIVGHDIGAADLERIIRATEYLNHHPSIVLHGYRFSLTLNS